MKFQFIQRIKLLNAGFKQIDDFNFVKENIDVEVYKHTILVKRMYNSHEVGGSYTLPLIATSNFFDGYMYTDIPFKKVIEWLCSDLNRLEMNAENYLLSKSLEVLD